jgi:hypothetical protein
VWGSGGVAFKMFQLSVQHTVSLRFEGKSNNGSSVWRPSSRIAARDDEAVHKADRACMTLPSKCRASIPAARDGLN